MMMIMMMMMMMMIEGVIFIYVKVNTEIQTDTLAFIVTIFWSYRN
jgi:hypothetical protein